MPVIATQQELHVWPSVWADDDAKIDEALLESFPASDAPPWTLKVSARPFRTQGCEDGRLKETAMKVKDIMTTDLKTCTPDTTVAEAAHLMWDRDCGILPVVDEGELVGVVTDRDMYIALATQNARASRLKVGAVATKKLATCTPEDDVQTALATLKQARVRRLPVVGPDGSVVGILSVNDILLAAGPGKAVGNEEVVETLQAICAHSLVPDVVAA